MKIFAFVLKDYFLDKEYKNFIKRKYKIEFTFQEMIESMYTPTNHISDWFIKNKVEYTKVELGENLLTKERKTEIANEVIMNSYLDMNK